ncbi:MAG: hypothetical protein ACXWR1_10205 [Bdellovibrionota bacterium]
MSEQQHFSGSSKVLMLVGLFLLALAHAQGDEETVKWTDHFSSKEGSYAVAVDQSEKRVLIIRADDRGNGNTKLRMRVGTALIPLRAVSGVHSPWRYASEKSAIDFSATILTLEASEDGKAWKPVGTFQRP